MPKTSEPSQPPNADRSGAPLIFDIWISYPARNISMVSPNCETADTSALSWAMSSTSGPTRMPPSSSSTTAGMAIHRATTSEVSTGEHADTQADRDGAGGLDPDVGWKHSRRLDPR